MHLRVILDDLFRDLVQHLAPHLLILLDLPALTSSAISHETSLVRDRANLLQGVCHPLAGQRIARSSALRFPSVGFDTALFVVPALLGANRPDEHDVDDDQDEQQETEIQEEREHLARVYPRLPMLPRVSDLRPPAQPTACCNRVLSCAR